MYLQLQIADAPIAYRTLFRYSWRNFLVVALTAPLVWGVALILFLWGALFQAIGVDFFADLFAKDWFLFPVLAVAFPVDRRGGRDLPRRTAVHGPAAAVGNRQRHRPEPFDMPEGLRPFIESSYVARYDNLVLVAVDLNQDQILEYVLIGTTEFDVLWAEGFHRQDDEWLSLNVRRDVSAFSEVEFEISLQSGEIEAIPPEFQQLRIGEVEFSFMPR